MPVVILVVIAIVVIATGASYLNTATGPTGYACISITHQGNNEVVKTTGLLHYTKSQYFISCSEGSSLPTSQYTASCLTISPKTITAVIGLGASTEYYYISANGNSITLNGATAPVNSTEYVNAAALSLSISC
jgi:bisphosphoglycerate-dependent phosphoglycerate mutase